ncbi:hypothetical protein ACXAUS_001571 [Clostridium sporogenes]|uniref:hypothetical protein n=1 Tax=Clostridium sporogenes TaxID=1509 RepID=UPI0028FFEC2E|nr:hypothetical protein [Clostridium botulinum]
MKYIGPFLRMNTLDPSNIYSQMNFLAKESLQNIILHSNCGICIPFSELKLKNDFADSKNFSSCTPLLCVYKKANPKLINSNKKLTWNDSKFKKEVNILGNSFMVLSLLQLIEYYEQFKDKNKNLYSYTKLYNKLCKKQLEFFATYFRNEEGVFVDKLDVSDSILSKIDFKEKNKKFNFSNQCFLMCAYYGTSLLDKDDYCSNYNDFSLDILNMFLDYKDELYTLSTDEISKLCLGMNIFYKYSKNDDSKVLLLDLSELLQEKLKEKDLNTEKKVDTYCLAYIDFMLTFNNLGILKFKNLSKKIYKSLIKLYNDNLSMFIKNTDKKEIKYSCDELILYLLVLLNEYKNDKENSDKNLLLKFYRNQIINSGIILSWPEEPALNSIERYKNFSLKSEDLLDEQCFRMGSIPSPEAIEIAPVLAKYVEYNTKKQEFTNCRNSFDSNKNFFLWFLILYTLKN